MTGIVLGVLPSVTVLLALLGLSAAAGIALRAPRGATMLLAGTAAAGSASLLLGFAVLLRPDALPWDLPLAPGRRALTVALDGLSGWFLLVLGAATLATCAWLLTREDVVSRARLVPLPLFVAGAVLTVVAADAVALLLGFETTLLAAWALVAAEPGRDGSVRPGSRLAVRRQLLSVVLAGACLLAALAIWSAGAQDLSFAALRAAPPEGWRAVLVPVLAVAGTGAAMGSLPPHAPVPSAGSSRPAPPVVSATGKVSLYVLARLLLDLGAPASSWWAAPLVALGAASAVTGALRSAVGGDVRTVLAAAAAAHVGLLLIALGLVPLFRAADLGPLAALAAAALLLHALARVLAETLLFLVAAAVEQAAGSGSLDGLGGLVRPMPLVALCAAFGVLGTAGLPLGLGFASGWLLLQSLLAAWRTGEPGVQLVAAAALAATALTLALGAAAAVRWFGLVFLGRPRGPRAAGAADAAGFALAALLALAALVPILGLLPGPLLQLADPALRVLSGTAMEARAGALALHVGDGMGSYLPAAAALLLLGCGAALFAAVRTCSPQPSVRGPAWDGGIAASPVHLPFGDPAAQPNATGLAQPLRRAAGLLPTRTGRTGTAHASGACAASFVLPARVRAIRTPRTQPSGDASGRRDIGLALASLMVLLLLALA